MRCATFFRGLFAELWIIINFLSIKGCHHFSSLETPKHGIIGNHLKITFFGISAFFGNPLKLKGFSNVLGPFPHIFFGPVSFF